MLHTAQEPGRPGTALSNDVFKDIRLLACDVDGVLTDGRFYYSDAGGEVKVFCAQDGLALVAAQRAGLHVALVSGRRSRAVERRAQELKIAHLLQGVSNKLDAVARLADKLGIALREVAYVGDDLPDLPCMEAVGAGVAVADAAEEVKQAARYVTRCPGGAGAVRELVRLILLSQGKWNQVVSSYARRPPQAEGEAEP